MAGTEDNRKILDYRYNIGTGRIKYIEAQVKGITPTQALPRQGGGWEEESGSNFPSLDGRGLRGG